MHDSRVRCIADRIIDSFGTYSTNQRRIGLPLGNVTSQLFANVYLHELDQFIKHNLQQKYYLRYCDDFIVVAHEKTQLTALIEPIQTFLAQTLRLTLHPKKIILSNMHQGIDFLGYVLFLHHRLLRTRTKRRMKRRLKEQYTAYLQHKIDPNHMDQCLQSYLGILSHANSHYLAQSLKNAYWIRETKTNSMLATHPAGSRGKSPGNSA